MLRESSTEMTLRGVSEMPLIRGLGDPFLGVAPFGLAAAVGSSSSAGSSVAGAAAGLGDLGDFGDVGDEPSDPGDSGEPGEPGEPGPSSTSEEGFAQLTWAKELHGIWWPSNGKL